MERKTLRKIAAREAHYETRRAIRRAWMVFLAAAGIAALGAIVYFSSLVSPGGESSAETSPGTGLVDRVVIGDLVNAATAQLEAYLAAPTVEERLRYVYNPAATRPLMEEYYRTHPFESGDLEGIFEGSTHVSGDRRFLIGTAGMRDGIDRLCVFELTDGPPLLIWEVAVAYSEMDWPAFIADRVTEPTLFRVTMARSDYFNYQFSDEDRFLCFQLSRPGEEQTLYGYLERDTPAWKRFTTVRSLSILSALPVVARLRYPDNPQSGNQVLIDSFVSFSWVDGVEM